MGQQTERSEPPDEDSEPPPRLAANLSRRAVLKVGTFGAAAAGAVAAFPALFAELVSTAPAVSSGAAEAPAVAGEAESAVPAIEGLIVAHIRDAATGEMSLYVGEREVVYKDLPLVQQLARAAHR